MSPAKAKTPEDSGLGALTAHEIALIEATRKIPADGGERYRRTMSIIEYINALADGMNSADAKKSANA